MSEGLAENPYLAARVELEPATVRMQGNESTTEPPGPYNGWVDSDGLSGTEIGLGFGRKAFGCKLLHQSGIHVALVRSNEVRLRSE